MINALKINADYLAKSLEGISKMINEKGNSILVVSSSEKENSLLVNVIDKQLRLKEDCTSEIQAVKQYYYTSAKQILDKKKLDMFASEMETTISSLQQTLIEGSLFRMNDKSLEDYALANGAMLSSKMVYYYLSGALFVDGRNIIVSDDSYGNAVINWDATSEKVKGAFSSVKGLAIVSGGFGKTKDGYTTSLGKGGADLTATTIGAILKSESIVFYSFADGIYNADPSIIRDAKSLASLTYEEAAQLSFSEKGAIYPPAIWPAVKEGIPIIVKNALNLEFKGTYISASDDASDKKAIKGISCISDVELITVYGNGLLGQIGTSSRLFGLLAENDINILFISQSSSEYSISFAVSSSDGAKAVEVISKARKNKRFLSLEETVFVKKNVGIVSVCGNKMRNVPGISGKVYTLLGEAGVNIIAAAQGGEELNISVVVKGKELEKGVRGIYEGLVR